MATHYYTWTIDDVMVFTIASSFKLPLDRLEGTGIEQVNSVQWIQAAATLEAAGMDYNVIEIGGDGIAPNDAAMDKLISTLQYTALDAIAQNTMMKRGGA